MNKKENRRKSKKIARKKNISNNYNKKQKDSDKNKFNLMSKEESRKNNKLKFADKKLKDKDK